MRHRIVSCFLLLLVLIGLTPSVWAADAEEDVLAQFAWEFRQGVEDPSSDSRVIQLPAGANIDELLKETFARYPAMFYYYSTYSYQPSSSGGTAYQIYYRNQDKGYDDFYVVTNDDELMASYGLASADLKQWEFVTAGGYTWDDATYARITKRMVNEYGLVYMGVCGYSGQCSEDSLFDGQYNAYDLGMWDGIDRNTVYEWRDKSESKLLELSKSLFAMDMPQAQKVLLIHDWLINNNRYDIDDMNNPLNHVGFGALVRGLCVCQGYAEAAQLLFQSAGVESQVIIGESNGESHAWNAVKVDGQWYTIDITWDDPLTPDGQQILRYDYFLLSDAEMNVDHRADPESTYPVCPSSGPSAEEIKQQMDADTTTYTQYTDEKVKTLDKCRRELQAIIDQNPKQLPPDPNAPSQEEETVDPTQPTDSVPSDTEPAPADTDDADQPVPPVQPDPSPSIQPWENLMPTKPEQTSVSLSTILLALAVLTVTVIIIIHMIANRRICKAREERAAQRSRRMDL